MMPSNDLIPCHPLLLPPSIFPSIRVFSKKSWLFASGGQRIGASASASVLSMNVQDWSPLEWTGWIFLQSKGLKSLLHHHSSKASVLQCFLMVTINVCILAILFSDYTQQNSNLTLTEMLCISGEESYLDRLSLAQLTQLFLTSILECPFYKVKVWARCIISLQGWVSLLPSSPPPLPPSPPDPQLPFKFLVFWAE